MAVVDGGGSSSQARAGESAQAEYERRAARDAERRRAGRRKTMVLIALAPFIGYALVRVGAVLLDVLVDRVQSWAKSSMDATSEPQARESIFEADTLHTFGLYGAAGTTLWVIGVRLGRRQTTAAWRVGAEGERRTGNALDPLPSGFHVLHDLRMPGSRANIDHVVVGPTGVFTIETKNYAKGIAIRGGKARSNGRVLDSVVTQAKRQAEVISGRLGTPTTPIVCVHGGGLRIEGWFQTPVVDGVRFCSGRHLPSVLTKQRAVHGPDAVAAMASTLRLF